MLAEQVVPTCGIQSISHGLRVEALALARGDLLDVPESDWRFSSQLLPDRIKQFQLLWCPIKQPSDLQFTVAMGIEEPLRVALQDQRSNFSASGESIHHVDRLSANPFFVKAQPNLAKVEQPSCPSCPSHEVAGVV